MTHPRLSFILAALCACVLCGCSKKETPSAQPTPEQAAQIEADYLPTRENSAQPTTAAASSPPAAPARPVAAQQIDRPVQERLNGAVHAKLTVQLRMYIEKNGRMPETFSEFSNSAMDSVPLAPEGMKFAIDPTDRTVKAVKK